MERPLQGLRPGTVAASAVVLVLLTSPTALGATFIPTRFDDPSPGKCKAADCSLREALRAANDKNGRDRVILGKGRYYLEIPADSGFGIEAGDLNVSGPLTLAGKGPLRTQVDANRRDRVFTTAGRDVTFAGFTITDGHSGADPGHSDVGGGITAIGDSLRLRNLAIKENEAQFGGGISSTATELTVKNTTIERNVAMEGAGLNLQPAFSEVPTTVIRSSTIAYNFAGLKGAGMLADGISSFGAGASMTPVVALLNSTVANNASGGYEPPQGGGIIADNGATVTLDNSTVAQNRAGDESQNGIAGGIYQHSGATFIVGDSVIARNYVGFGGTTTSTASGAGCVGSFQGAGGVLLQTQAGSACSIGGGATATDTAGLDLELSDNGGPTHTMRLLFGSPAIGFAESCPREDQRGVVRPPTDCDSGAFERKNP